MFLGDYSHTLDDKGRLFVPSRFREELGEVFVATTGLDACIFIYPMEEWKNIEQRLRSLPLNHPEARAFLRTFFSGATEMTCDKQGRVVIPQKLRDYAHLNRDCEFIGVGNRAEIWSAEVWQQYNTANASGFSKLAESLGDLFL